MSIRDLVKTLRAPQSEPTPIHTTEKEHVMPITTQTPGYERLRDPGVPQPKPEPKPEPPLPWTPSNDPVSIGTIVHVVQAGETVCTAYWVAKAITPDRLGSKRERQMQHPDCQCRSLGSNVTSRPVFCTWSDSNEATEPYRDGVPRASTWHHMTDPARGTVCPFGK